MERIQREHRSLSGLFVAVLSLALASVVTAATKQNPYEKPDGSWISIHGTVESVTPNTFMLDYGDGTITVEMDDGDRDADAYKLLSGDKVTVSGRIDDDFYERTKIEASSVFVEKLGTYFFASSRDEEDPAFSNVTVPVPISTVVVHGVVTEVNGDDFTIDTGTRNLTVDVEDLGYDPLDDEGYQKIRIGDFVKVGGPMDRAFFEGRQLMADYVVKQSS